MMRSVLSGVVRRASARITAFTRCILLCCLALVAGCSTTGSDQNSAKAPDAQLFFYYSCIHCNNFYRDQLKPFRQQHPQLVIQEVAIAVFPFQYSMAKAFYAAELAGINPAFHEAAYNAHRADRLMRPDAQYYAEMAASCCNLPKERFLTLYHSPEVEAKFQEAQSLKTLLQINSVPVVMQNGQRTELNALIP